MKKFLKNINLRQYIFIFLIIAISVVNLRYFFKPGLFRAHDIENHLARIANYYLAVKDGHIPPRWAKNLNHKFGYPVFNYNYPLANILAYPLIVVGFSIENCLKIILFSAYLFSGISFYLWAKKHLKPLSAFIGAVFYLCAPYQFLDLYVRGAVGENLSFFLFPAVLYFLKLLSEKTTRLRFLGLVFFTAFFSLSHNIMVLIFSPLIFIYWLYLYYNSGFSKKLKTKFIKVGLTGIWLGFLLTSFFWIPAVGEREFVTLEAFNPKTFYQDHFVELKQLIFSPWQYGYSILGPDDTMSFQIGLPHWLVVLLTIPIGLFVFRSGRTQKRQLAFLIPQLIFWLAVFLMLPISLVLWKLTPFLGYLQFPWRFLSLTMFAASFLAALAAEKQKILGTGLMVLCLIYAQQMVKPFFWEKKSDMTYYDFLFTTSTMHENMPRWYTEENLNRFKSRFSSDTGLVKFNELSWKTNEHVYEIQAEEPSYIWEQTAYFPGWQAYINGEKAEIKYDHKDYPGLISLKVSKGKHLIKLRFTENTLARIIGDCLSVLALFLVLVKLKFMVRKDK